jgi:hypothetical protein
LKQRAVARRRVLIARFAIDPAFGMPIIPVRWMPLAYPERLCERDWGSHR